MTKQLTPEQEESLNALMRRATGRPMPNREELVRRAVQEVIPEVVDERDAPKPRDVPQHGEQAAEAILKMAEERADYIMHFGQEMVERARKWEELAERLAADIRRVAAAEAEAIRRETARMHAAGMAVEAAIKEFRVNTVTPQPVNKQV